MKLNSFAIEIYLAEKAWNKTEFAHRCGLSRQALSTILQRGTCEPKTAGKLAMGLGIPVSEILEREV